MSSHPTPLSHDFENSIPQTTTLFNRMYKRGATNSSSGGTAGTSGPKIPGSGYRPSADKRKVRTFLDGWKIGAEAHQRMGDRNSVRPIVLEEGFELNLPFTFFKATKL